MVRESKVAMLLLSSSLAANALLPAVARAEAASEAGTPEPADAASQSEALQEVVVSARLRTERWVDVPVAVTAATPEQIRQYDLTSMANVRLVAPQITLDRGFTGSGTSVSMRGVSSSSLDAGVEQSILLVFDGMEMSRGRILNDALFDVASIEVMKGPQALFFGKNSPGGVVAVKSADPTQEFSGFARVGYELTSNHTRSFEGAVSGPVTDGLGFRVAGFASKSDGYIQNQDAGVPDLIRTAASGSTFVPAAQPDLGAEEKEAVRLTLKYDPGTQFDADFKLMLSRYRGQSLQSFDEVMACPAGRTQPVTTGGIVDPNGDCRLNDKSSQGWLSQTIINSWPEVSKYDAGRPFSKDDTILPTLTLNYRLGPVNLTSITGYYNYDYVSQGNADGTSYSYFWSYSDEKNGSYYQELRAVTALDGMINFAGGGHYEYNDRTLYVGGANGPNRLDPATGRYNLYDNEQHNKSHAESVFGQAILKLPGHMELTGGGRYTSENKSLDSFNKYLNPNGVGVASYLPPGKVIAGSKSEHNFSPEATLSWHPTDEILLYGAYKTGYLSGGFSNPGTLSSISTLQTLSYNAEKAKGFEGGIKASLLDNKLTGSLTAFRYKYEGLPLTSLIALSSTAVTFVTQNAASTITRGLEFETTWRPVTGLTFRGSASYDQAYFEEFDAAQCYTGQTVAQGCLVAPVTGAKTQNLSGRPLYRAPKWLLTSGAAYEFAVTSGLRLSVNGDLRFTSGYYTGLNLNPLSYQSDFTTFNSGIRLSPDSDRWSVAVIGRNLSNRRYGTLGVDKPGGLGEVYTVAGEPRVVLLQGEARF
jgi:outer membrane receptor protein involved in Fe transport